jgi:hypothetical protein
VQADFGEQSSENQAILLEDKKIGKHRGWIQDAIAIYERPRDTPPWDCA